MFNKDFYPTPKDTILQMIGDNDLSNKVILEPSAGKGDIVDCLIDHGASVLTCEINQDLAKLVQLKSKFIKHDFLDVESHEISHINSIYMNPPFSADEKHILHAWKVAPSGCHIVSLCNYSTLSNDYSYDRRELVRLIKDYGNSTNIGDAFSDSERQTGVEIGLINLYKPKTDNDFGDYFDTGSDDFEAQENGIMSYNSIRDVVMSYVAACKLYDNVIETGIKMDALVGKFGVSDISFTCSEGKIITTKSDFQRGLQKKAWQWVFNKMNMGKFMTQSLKADINKFVEQQHKIPFTMKNIYKMFELVIGTNSQRMDRVMVEVFDNLTKHYSENRYNVEGWKTNSHYLMGKKFILPYMCPADKWSNGNKIHTSYGRYFEKIEDLIKALCFLTGTNFEHCIGLSSFLNNNYKLRDLNGKYIRSQYGADTFKNYNDAIEQQTRLEGKGIKTIIQYNSNEYGEWQEWDFFKIKAFKKGSMHFIFNDENVWALFNRAVAKIKGYPLPEKI